MICDISISIENRCHAALSRDFEPGEVILQDEPLLVTKEGEKVLISIDPFLL